MEEILRAFYPTSAGRGTWRLVKRDAADTFAGPGRGGTALLDELDALRVGPRPDMRVVLVGHSTGAVLLSHFLQAAADRDAVRHTFDLVLLAPAATFDLFADTLERAGHLVGTTIAPHVRLFGLRDDAERRDVLVPVHYPHSLLYFISGVCEDEVDAPLIGMQRFFADRYRRLPGVRRVVERLDAPWEAWAATESEAGDGWRTRASSHLAFGEEVTTLESVRHLVATGY